MSTPFIIYGLPRSRTYWLSKFLSYGDYECAHDQARHVRDAADVKSWLSMDFTGTAETAAAPWWRLVRHYRPDIKVLVARRPVKDAVDSWMRLGVGTARRGEVTRLFTRLDRKLDQIEARATNVMSVNFDDLRDEDVCAAVFEHCLPYRHDPAWWDGISDQNLQCDMRAMTRYCVAHRPRMMRAIDVCQSVSLEILRKEHPASVKDDGVTIQEEPFADFWRDAQSLFAEHCVAVGEPKDQFKRKNLPLIERLAALGAVQIITARCNGRMLGYLASVINPSLEDVDLSVATQTIFFASQDAKGMRLGARLQRGAISAAQKRGVKEIIMRAGVRGSGPKMGALYRRLGAEDYGHLYKLQVA